MKNKSTKEKQFYNDIKRAFQKIGIKVDEIYFKREIVRKTYTRNSPETKAIIVGDNIFLECINVGNIQYPENPKDYKSNDSILPCVLARENEITINPLREIKKTAAIAMSKTMMRECDILLKSKNALKPAPQAIKQNRKKS